MQAWKRVVNRRVLLVALFSATLSMAGCSTGDSSTSDGSHVTATPTFSPGAGTYNTAKAVTIADTTPGAVLYCTTDGSTPSASSPQCSQPTTVYKTEFLQAIAVAPGKSASAVASAGYTITLNAAATPTFSPDGGSYNGSQQVAISDTTSGANIYYTLDGSTPGPNSTLYVAPVSITKSLTLSAIAIASGYANSGVRSAGYTIGIGPAAPVISPAGGTFSSTQTVTIADATAVAAIYYTLDGSTPTASSTLYNGSFTVSSSQTVSAIAIAGGVSSAVTRASFTINVTAAPVISPAGGSFTTVQPVTITDATAGAAIYYTLDGSTPTSSSALYTAAITVSSSQTVSAIAIANGVSSSVTRASFTITLPAAEAPTFNPPAGTYASAQQVILSDGTANATMYYTLDGSSPTTASNRYNGTSVNVTASGTLKAIATASGYSTSPAASAAYTITNSVAAPTFSPAAGTYTSAQQVTLSDTDSIATIYYTLDGSTPTTSSTRYSGPFNVGSSQTVTAIAVNGSVSSSVATAAYTINLGPMYSGKVMSGTAPVVGATVQMYVAGSTGYASSATSLVTTAATSGADGSFTLNYNCPAAPADLVYVVATGGHTGSNTASNAGLSFLAALGSCNGTLPANVVVNEVTTVASAYALSQFMSDATHLGSTATNYQTGGGNLPGLANAFATVGNLVDLTTGQSRDHTPAYPANLAGDTNMLNNSTVPQTRINALANDLNVCAANSSGCSTLYSAATPQGGSGPTDTLGAILDIAQHPGNNASMVFNVAAGSGPFAPALSAAPNDWTLALTFTGGGLGFTPDYQITAPFSAAVFKMMASAMDIDAVGNIWVTGFAETRTSTTTSVNADTRSGMIAKFNNLGGSLTPASTIDGQGNVTYGGYVPYQPDSTGANLAKSGFNAPNAIALDPSGSAWLRGAVFNNLCSGSSISTVTAMSKVGADLSMAIPCLSLASAAVPSIGIDGIGNVWTMASGMTEYNTSGTVVVSNAGKYGTQTLGYGNPQSLVFDSSGNSLWTSDFHTILSGKNYVTLDRINPVDATKAYGGYYLTYNGLTSPLAVGSAKSDGTAGNIYGCTDSGSQTLDVFNASANAIVSTYAVATGRGCGQQMVMDGLGHLFTITGSPGATITPGIIDEFSVTDSGITQLTGTGGLTGTSTGEVAKINGDPTAPPIVASKYVIPRSGVVGAALDGSGNLWVLNTDTGTAASPGNVLVEFIGLGAPVVTPKSLALQYGEVGARP